MQTEESRSRASSREVIDRFMTFWDKEVQRWDIKPERLANLDETGFTLSTTQSTTYGTHPIHVHTPQDRRNLTAVPLVFANGDYVDPFFIMPGQCP